MLKRFLKDSVLYGGANILSRGVALLLLPIYTRLFTTSEYGQIELITVIGTLVNLTVALEISQGLARHYSEVETDKERQGYASTALWFSLSAYLLFGAAAVAFAEPLSGWILNDRGASGIIRVAAIALALGGLFLGLQNQLRWQMKPRGYAATSLTFTVVSAGAALALVVGLRSGVYGVFLGQIVGAVVGCIMAVYQGREVYRLRFDRAKLKAMLGFSLPLVPSSIAVFTTLYADRLILGALTTLAEVGLYGVGYRIASTVGLLLSGFQTALTPLIYQRYKEPDAPVQLARIFRVFLGTTLPLVLALSLFAPEVLLLFAAPSYGVAASIIPVLALVFMLSNAYVFAPGLAIAKKTGLMASINVTTAVLNTGLNVVMIPRWGIMGAAMASLVGAATAFMLYMTFSQKLYPVPHRWPVIGACGIGVALLYAGGRLLEQGNAMPAIAVVGVKVLLVAMGVGWSLFLMVGRQDLARLIHGWRKI